MKRSRKRRTSLTQSREDAKGSRLVTSLCASAPLRDGPTEFVSRKALAAGSSVSMTDRIAEFVGGAVEMSFPRYPKYKDSGVEWLGDVPEHWTLKRLKHISPFITVGIVVNPSTFVADDGFPFIYGGDIREGVIDCENARRIDAVSSLANSKTQLKAGDLLTVRVGAPGVTAVVPPECEDGNCASVMLIRQGAFNSHWLCYTMNTRVVRFQVEVVQYGAAQEQFNISHAVNFWVPLPPRNEQTAIAAFLDRETGKIDELVAEQRRLIELLKEKRQAVISHAVTKGLNPHAPTKPSGIEWLGDVPEHWEVKPLGRLGQLQNGLNIGGEAFGAGDPFVSYGDAYKNPNVPKTPSGLVLSTSSDQAKCDLRIGDVLFTRTSETVDDIGVASTCLCSIPRVTFAGFLIRFRPTQGLLEPRYSTFLFRNQGVQGHFSGTMNLVTRASLSQDVLKMLPICIPPLVEQEAIAQFIEKQVAAFGDLTAEAQRGIELLQERRTALISAAVTGNIDVRGAIEKEAS